MSFKKLSGLTLACAMALGAASAQAGLVVSLYDGATTITIADNQVGDLDPSNNNIAYFGSIGVWTYSFSGAISSAPDGQPGVHFTSADSSSGAGTLRVTFQTTDYAFNNPTGATSVVSGFSSTTAGTVQADTFLKVDPSTSFSLVSSQGPMGPGSVAQTVATPVNIGGNFDLKQTVTIVHSARGTTSFDDQVSVPEPAILGLLGLGLLGFGFARRRASS